MQLSHLLMYRDWNKLKIWSDTFLSKNTIKENI